MRAHSVLRRELEAEVLSPRGLTINDFEALFHLYRAEDKRLRRVDLVELLMLTPSGVTRLLDGLQGAGLVENVALRVGRARRLGAADRRGPETLECVGVEHTRAAPLTLPGRPRDDEVAQLSELLGRLPGVDAGSCAG